MQKIRMRIIIISFMRCWNDLIMSSAASLMTVSRNVRPAISTFKLTNFEHYFWKRAHIYLTSGRYEKNWHKQCFFKNRAYLWTMQPFSSSVWVQSFPLFFCSLTIALKILQTDIWLLSLEKWKAVLLTIVLRLASTHCKAASTGLKSIKISPQKLYNFSIQSEISLPD